MPDYPEELAEGAEGDEVRQLQEALNRLTALKPDGVFDRRTEALVKLFQQQNGLPPDGVVDRHTWEKLQELTVRKQDEETALTQ